MRVPFFWQKYKYISSICLLVLLTSCSWFEKTEDDPTKDLFKSEGIHYDVVFSSSMPSSLDASIRKNSKLLRLAINRPSSKNALLNRAQKDQEAFLYILQMEGYFDGKVEFKVHDLIHKDGKEKEVNDENLSAEKSQIKIEFIIIPGQRYSIGGLNINTEGLSNFKEKQTVRLTEDIIGLKTGDVVELNKIEDVKQKIKKYFVEHGYPFVEINYPIGTINKAEHLLFITFPVILNQYAIIAGTKIEGLTQIKAEFVENRIKWQNGECYNEKNVKRTQKKMLASNIISNFQVTPEVISRTNDESSPDTLVLMRVKASEGKPRTIGAGARYSTSEGIGGRVFWHHNNVFGNGEHLGASYKTSTREQRGKISYDIPDIGGPENILSFQEIWLREKTRGYSGRTITTGVSYEVPIKDSLHISGGIVNDASHLYAQNLIFNSHLIGIPIIAKVDTSNDFLDPSQGMRVTLEGTPYWGKLGGKKMQVTRALGNLQFYLPLKQNELGEGQFVLASYIKAGTLFIPNFNLTPPNKRFYGGGASSIRSYGYQMVGPLDASNIPTGGRSISEWGTEIRMRATERIGLATFFEAATVTTKRTPEFGSKNTLYGAGVGVRYFSGFGPIRFDVAFPFTRRRNVNRKHIDSAFQFYISVGQAF
ncbi:MAG: BamA/TamA family outer membrane protein [Candidatus Paracaedibacteraceae bacterium]|nr:BamA/TamA family outer membrane protein [Candidatus Paracaedibacteraceae bacterium]